MNKTILILIVWIVGCLGMLAPQRLYAAHQPNYSAAGFFELPNTGRVVYNMNPAWHFHQGEMAGAEQKEFNDSEWQLTSLPNGIEYLPYEASGCTNYQGAV